MADANGLEINFGAVRHFIIDDLPSQPGSPQPIPRRPQNLSYRRICLLLACGGIICCLGVYAAHLRQNWGTVVAGSVYRSAQPNADQVRKYAAGPGVRTIVNLRGKWENAGWYRNERAAAAELGIVLHDIPLFTHRLAPMEQLRQLVQVFDESPKPLLIHCRRGADRTSLASALYLALKENVSLDDALKSYRLWYGHTGWARGRGQPHVFDVYADWLRSRNATHSPTLLREWIATTPTIAHFSAAIVCTDLPTAASVGEPRTLRFQIANTSAYPWKTARPIERGVHFWIGTYQPATGISTSRRIALPAECVEPGQTVAIEAPLPAFNEEGPLQIAADLYDADDLKFCEMGVGGWGAKLQIAGAKSRLLR